MCACPAAAGHGKDVLRAGMRGLASVLPAAPSFYVRPVQHRFILMCLVRAIGTLAVQAAVQATLYAQESFDFAMVVAESKRMT